MSDHEEMYAFYEERIIFVKIYEI